MEARTPTREVRDRGGGRLEEVEDVVGPRGGGVRRGLECLEEGCGVRGKYAWFVMDLRMVKIMRVTIQASREIIKAIRATICWQ